MEKENQDKIENKSISKNTIFYLFYNIINVAFPFIMGIYVARVLLPERIGQVASAQNLVQYFVILAFLGIPTYGLREISKFRKDKSNMNKVYSELMCINLISTIVFLTIYIILIFSVEIYRSSIELYLITGVLIAINVLNNEWLYEGVEDFKIVSLRNLFVKIISFILLIVFVKSENDYLIYAGITVLSTVITYVFNILYSKKYVKFQFKDLNLKRHLKPIMFLVVVNLAIEIYTLVDITMLNIMCDDVNVAIYSYGSKINKILLQILNCFTMVIVPRLTLYYKNKQQNEFNDLISKGIKIICLLAIPMCIGIQFVSDFLISAVYGESFANSANVLKILSFSLMITPIGYLLGSRVLLVTDNEKKMVIAVGSGAIVNFIGNLILIPLYKEYGAAFASVVGEIVVMCTYVFLGKKHYKLQNFKLDFLKIVISNLFMLGSLFLINMVKLNNELLSTIITIIVALAVYGILLLVLKEELVYNVINKIFNRKKGQDETINS